MSRSRLALVALEDRTVPANLIWTGDVDDRWGTNTLGNTNWAFDLLPHNGDSLVFPASSQHHSNTNNLNGLVINNITLQFSQAIIGGNAITLTGNLLDSSQNPGSFNELTMPITLSAGVHTVTISSSPGSTPNSDGFGRLSESGGSASLIKEGAGTLVFRSSNSYTGVTTVNAGDLILFNNSGVSIPGDLVINNAFVTELLAGGLIADTSAVTINSGGTLTLEGHFDRVGSLHVASGGILDLTGSDQGLLHANSVLLDSGSELSMQVGRPGFVPPDAIVSFGPVHLGGTLGLNVGSADPVGTRFTLIDNDGSDPVTGTFDGLPQGAIMDINGHLYTIDYAGDTGNDVVLTRRANVIVTNTRINDGSAQRSRLTSLTVTFSDPVTFSITPATAFTLVRNSDGAVETFNATATVMNGVTVVTLDNFSGNATQFGSLADGRYTLTALASQISFFGEPLDGNGNGTAGDNFTFNDTQGLFRFFGDINGDRHVDIADFGLFSSTFNLSTGQTGFIAAFDFNNDGHIDIADFGQFSIRLFTLLP
jgi:autotransporter-associated beta strand protein